MPPKLIEGTSAPICYFFKIYNPYYLHEKGLDRFSDGSRVEAVIKTCEGPVIIPYDKRPILYKGLGIWELLSYQELVKED